ncbi:hypothetical protein J2T14_003584 [Paenibacillus harenae]|nr:hypothetical protein [Paenibacillus harenae]
MPINFHEERNRMTYTTRAADDCAGGIYTESFVSMVHRTLSA